MKNDFLVVIPARLGSKRLPGKPLIKFKGIPMIIKTFIQCNKVIKKDKILIATDSKRIKKVCNQYNVNCIITSKKCLTGTDRVFEVAKKIKKKFYINLQGDEPFFYPKDIKKFINFSKKNSSQIINGYCQINKKEDYFNVNVPKVVFNNQKNLLYMSRSPIPGNKKKLFQKAFRQVCIYSFPREKLLRFGKQKKKSLFEYEEDIEILRFIEIGEKVKMIKLSSNSLSVDTKKDYIAAKKKFEKIK